MHACTAMEKTATKLHKSQPLTVELCDSDEYSGGSADVVVADEADVAWNE